MVLIITSAVTERLRYICHLIFKEQLGINFSFSTQLNEQVLTDKIVIHYHPQSCPAGQLQIKPHHLLFEEGVSNQTIDVFDFVSIADSGKLIPAFFKTSDNTFSFDIFAAAFFLLTRYEEYLTDETDEYGRFPHVSSIAFKKQFISLPLVNIWIAEMAAWLKRHHPTLVFCPKKFESLITYDIDMAWSYRNKGLWRNLAGWLREPDSERIKVLTEKKADPFDCFNYISDCEIHSKNNSILFFLAAADRSRYDKNISPSHPEMVKLIQQLSHSFQIGWHPSWNSYGQPKMLEKEKQALGAIIKKQVIQSRQHYIRLQLPKTYQLLLQAGIKKEYSMGYGSINGFRASFAGSYLWYDLHSEQSTELRIYPFCYMDANSRFEQKQTVAASLNEISYYWQVCRQNNGLFISIFHNHLMGNNEEGLSWRKVHQHLISLIQQLFALHRDG